MILTVATLLCCVHRLDPKKRCQLETYKRNGRVLAVPSLNWMNSERTYAVLITCGFFIHWVCYMYCFCRIGNFGAEIEWQKFLSLACTALEKVKYIYMYRIIM